MPKLKVIQASFMEKALKHIRRKYSKKEGVGIMGCGKKKKGKKYA
jgi:hypothetical protein